MYISSKSDPDKFTVPLDEWMRTTRIQYSLYSLMEYNRKPRILMTSAIMIFIGHEFVQRITRTEQSKWTVLFNTEITLNTTVTKLSNKNEVLLINSTGCKLEKIEPFDDRFPEIKKYFTKLNPTFCNGSALSKFEDGVLQIDQMLLRQKFAGVTSCYYKPFDIEMPNIDKVKYLPPVEIEIGRKMKIKHEWILVECTSENEEVLYRNFHSQIIPREEFYGTKIESSGPDDFNVMFVVMESISRLTWLRHCQDIHKYITEKLGGILLNGHNVVGPNTAPNVYPTVRGRTLLEDMTKFIFGGVQFISTDFSNKGFATLAIEDILDKKLPFMIKNKVFARKPTLHFDRTFKTLYQFDNTLAIPDVNHQEEKYPTCYGPTNIFNHSIKYLIEFHRKYNLLGKKSMSISILKHGLHTHRKNNGLSKDKNMFWNFVRTLEETGISNNTIILLGADHGTRYGQGYFQTYTGKLTLRPPLHGPHQFSLHC